jgi:IS5 family transposase
MARQSSFFDIDDRLAELSAKDDDLERLNKLVDFELFRSSLEQAAPRKDRSKGGAPASIMCSCLRCRSSRPAIIFYERTEYLIKDRLSFMRGEFSAT